MCIQYAKTLLEAHELIAEFKKQLNQLALPHIVHYLEQNWFYERWLEKWLYLDGRLRYTHIICVTFH